MSQLSKAPVHHPQLNQKALRNVHITNPHWTQIRGGQRPTSINSLPQLSSLSLVHDARARAIRKSSRQVLLHQDAPIDLERGPVGNAGGVRRSGYSAGPTSARAGGRLKTEKPSAPPTFSNFAGTTPREISAEFAELRKLKPNLKKAVAHLMLSPGPDDRLFSKEDWEVALKVALRAHGAQDAAFAAYIHDDTDHRHLHVFFSRILPNGQVISDSHSYQKNRLATKQITQELQLTPLPSNPSQTAPGDRQAAQNATRSAERQGFAPVTAAEVRASVHAAHSFRDLPFQLEKTQVEAKFVTRGVENNTFGWMVRRVGTDEWIKASSLAKDLSWPKIAHRFAEADSAKEKPLLVSLSLDTPMPIAAQLAEKLVSQTQKTAEVEVVQVVQSQLAPSPSPSFVSQLDERLSDASTRNLLTLDSHPSPLYKTSVLLLSIGLEMARMSLRLAAAVFNFVKKLLALFGLNVTRVEHQAAPEAQPEIEYVAQLVPERQQASVDEIDDTAASALSRVIECLKNGTPSALPKIDGRDELVAAMAAEDEETVAAAAAAAGAGAAQSQGGPALHSDAETAREMLDADLELYYECFRALQAARGVDSQEVIDAKVALAKAQEDLDDIHSARQEKIEKTHPLLRLAIPPLKSISSVESAALVAATKNLAEAVEKYPTLVPQKIRDELADATKNLLGRAVKTKAMMAAEIQKLGADFQKTARLFETSFDSVKKQFEDHPTPTFCDLMARAAASFDREFAAARKAHFESVEDARREVEFQLNLRKQQDLEKGTDASGNSVDGDFRPGQG